MRPFTRALALTAAFALLGAGSASAASAPRSGGLGTTETTTAPVAQPAAPGAVAVPAGMRTTNGVKAKRYKGKTVDGRTAYFARVPLKAPAAVQQAVIAANKIVGKPYKWGGGHARIEDSGYDCSGTVSYALIGAGLMQTPLSSYEFDDKWAGAFEGPGQWITVYGNAGHAYAIIAGLRLDTSAAYDRGGAKGPQWRPDNRKDSKKFVAVHPADL